MDSYGIPIQKLNLPNLRSIWNKLTKTDIIHLAMTNKWAKDLIMAEKDLGYNAWGRLTVNVWNKDYQSSITLLENPFELEEYAHINCRKEPLEKRDFEEKCLTYSGRQFCHITVTRMEAKPIFFDDPILPYTETAEYILRSLEAANITCLHLRWGLNSHYSEAVKILKPKVVDCQNPEQLETALDENFPIYRLHLINLPYCPGLMKYDYLSQYTKDVTYDTFVNEVDYVIKTFKSNEKPSELYVAWGDVDDFRMDKFLDHWERRELHFFKYQKEDEQITLYCAVEAASPNIKRLPLVASCLFYKSPSSLSHSSYLFNCRLVKKLSDISFSLSGPKRSPTIVFPWEGCSKFDPIVPKEFVEFKRKISKYFNLPPE